MNDAENTSDNDFNKVLSLMKEEKRNSIISYIKKDWIGLLIPFVILILAIYILSPIILKGTITLSLFVGGILLLFLSIAIFYYSTRYIRYIDTIFEAEKYYYLWKKDIKDMNITNYSNVPMLFPRKWDSIRIKILSHVTGFQSESIFEKPVFDIRTDKTKKAIDVYFNFITEHMFYQKFVSAGNLVEGEDIVELFFTEFKQIFFPDPYMVNIVTLGHFFEKQNSILQQKFTVKYREIQEEVDNYYYKNANLMEKRSEQKFERNKLITSQVIGFLIVIGLAYLVQFLTSN